MKRIIENFPLGVFLGYLIATIFYFVLDDDYFEPWTKYFVYTIAVFVTLFSAGLAWSSSQRGIRTQLDIENKRRVGEHRAARATLPLALTRLTEIAESGLLLVRNDDAFFEDPNNVEFVVEELNLDTEIILIIQNCIRSSDEISGKWLAHIVSHYQVYRSRLISSIREPDLQILVQDKANAAADWIILKALIDHTYNFSRGSDSIPGTLTERLIRIPIRARFESLMFNELVAAAVAQRRNHYHPFDVNNFYLNDD